MSLYWKSDMTFEEANERVKEHIKEWDEIDFLDTEVDKAFDMVQFSGDMCEICDHKEECALGKYMKENEYDPVAKCSMWEYAY